MGALRDRAEWLPVDPTSVRRYLAVLFSGFWGNFGHMEAPLPVPVYGMLAVVSAAAVAYAVALGTLLGGLRRVPDRVPSSPPTGPGSSTGDRT